MYICIYNHIDWLVVEPPTPPKNMTMKVSWDYDNPNCFWKVIKFHGSKPPTSLKKHSHKKNSYPLVN